MPSTATRPWSFITMPPPSAQTMPSTSRTSAGSSFTNLSATAGRVSLSTSATRCATMRNIFSSTKPLPASNASCPFSTAKTTTTLSSPSKPPASPEAEMVSEKTKPAKNSPNPKNPSSSTAPTALMPSIPSILARKNSLTEMLPQFRQAEFCDLLS